MIKFMSKIKKPDLKSLALKISLKITIKILLILNFKTLNIIINLLPLNNST